MSEKHGKRPMVGLADEEARVTLDSAPAPSDDPSHWRGDLVDGHLVGIDSEGRLLFRREGSDESPMPVAIGVPLTDGALVTAVRLQRRALVARLAGGGLALVGLLRERVEPRLRDAKPGELEVLVDGETLNIHAERQIELRCGKASLLLQADGRVVLSGTYVVSTSRGPNKIKGATVSLN